MTDDIDILGLARAALADVTMPSDRRETEEQSLAQAMRSYAAAPLGADVPAALQSMGRVTARTVAMLYTPAVEAS